MSQPPSGARAVSVPAGRLPRWLDNFADRHGAVEVTADPAQVVVRAADGSTAWIEVPFPPLEPAVPGGSLASRPLTALQLHVARPRRVGVLLVRRGGYAAGVFSGDELLSSKVGSSYVQGTTKAGGWSQQRYARRRANQAHAAFAEAADIAVRILLPALGEAGGLVALGCGGDRAAVDETLSDTRLAPVAALPRVPFFPVPDPRLTVLKASIAEVRAVRIAVHP